MSSRILKTLTKETADVCTVSGLRYLVHTIMLFGLVVFAEVVYMDLPLGLLFALVRAFVYHPTFGLFIAHTHTLTHTHTHTHGHISVYVCLDNSLRLYCIDLSKTPKNAL